MSTKQVIFKLENEEYGLDVMMINSIEEYSEIVRIPNAPKNVLGLINLRGDVIPVYSLRSKFLFPPGKHNMNTRLIIIKSGELLIALEVDCVTEIIELGDNEVSETPMIVKNTETKYMKRVAKVRDRMIILLDIDNIFNDNEVKTIEIMMENQ